MKKFTVGLIVDNPTRDLDGLILVARELCRRGCRVFLIHMYSQGFEVPALGLDLVVLNYARKANTKLIQAYKKMGIYVCVLDTEGGVWEDEKQFVSSVNHEECADLVDMYCFWGERQKRAFKSMTRFDVDKLRVTGCPRYDFYHESLQMAIPILREFKRPPILVISNFALSNPRFALSDQEVDNMVQAGYEYKYALIRREVDAANRKSLKEVIRNLARDFPDNEIIVRPHPFEQDDDYKAEFCHLNNVVVTRSGAVASWLKPSSIAIHCNSSVAIDAFMMRRSMLTLGWVSSEVTRDMALISYNLSCVADSYQHMVEMIAEKMTPSGCNIIPLPDQNAVDLLNSWFQPCDGLAHVRFADEIDLVKESCVRSNLTLCGEFVRFGSKEWDKVKGRVDYFGRVILGADLYEKIRDAAASKVFGKAQRADKRFTVDDVASVLCRINAAKGDGYMCSARKTDANDYVFAQVGGGSVVLE